MEYMVQMRIEDLRNVIKAIQARMTWNGPFQKYYFMPFLPTPLPPTPSHSPVTRHIKVMKYIIQFPIYKHTKSLLILTNTRIFPI